MTVLANVMRELVGLFVDDGALALAIVAIVVLAGVMATLGLPLVAGAILLFGCLGVLLANTVSAGRR
jgi:2-keto-4-pentenoate hydratase